MDMLIRSAITLLNAYQFMILAYIISRLFPEFQNSKIAELLNRIVEPFLAIFRNVIPPIGGFDLSAMVAITLLQLAATGLSQW